MTVALVTGASRGIGKGIALELGSAGATVYVTGRGAPSRLPGSLEETAAEIDSLGGRGVAVPCDHTDDAAVAALFERIGNDGGLDVLVNNVYNSPAAARWLGKPFWQVPARAWDETFDVGVRSHYAAAVLAAPSMIDKRKGLIVAVSSPGAVKYMHNVVYGVGKTAVDRMTADMAHDLAGTGVAAVSIWPGIVNTELLQLVPRDAEGRRIVQLPGEGRFDLDEAETPRFAGRAVVALAGDPDVTALSGQAWTVAALAGRYGFTDVDGRVPGAQSTPVSITGLSPYLYYEDADAALRWLERVLGFGPSRRWLDPDGVLQEADIDVGPSQIGISNRASDDGRRASLIVHVTDIAATHAQAVREADVPVSDVEQQPYGPLSFHVTDPWGYTWFIWEGEVSPAPGWTQA